MKKYLKKPMAEVTKILEQSLIDTLITDWSARVKNNQFEISQSQIGNLWNKSGYFFYRGGEEIPKVLYEQHLWRVSEGLRKLIDDDYEFYQEILLIFAVNDETEFELAMEKANVSTEMRERLQWVLQEHDGIVPLLTMANHFSLTEDAIRKFVNRHSEQFEKTFWRVEISKKNVVIFKSKRVLNN